MLNAGQLRKIGAALDGADTLSRLSGKTRKLIEAEAATCFLCKRIIEALGSDGELRDWPPGGASDKPDFPVTAQRSHVMVVKGDRS